MARGLCTSAPAEAEKIKQYYSRYYPALPVETRQRSTRGQSITGQTITVWIKKLENVPDQKQDTALYRQQNNEPIKPVQQNNDPYVSGIVRIASGEIGYAEEPNGSNRTKYGQWFGNEKEPWGGIFISWVYDKAGKPLPYIDAKQAGFVSFSNALDYFRNRKLITTSPEPGDIVIFEAKDLNLSSSALNFDLIYGERNYNGGIFSGWIDEKKGVYEFIGASISSGSKRGVANSVVVKVQKIRNSSTYFIHVK